MTRYLIGVGALWISAGVVLWWVSGDVVLASMWSLAGTTGWLLHNGRRQNQLLARQNQLLGDVQTIRVTIAVRHPGNRPPDRLAGPVTLAELSTLFRYGRYNNGDAGPMELLAARNYGGLAGLGLEPITGGYLTVTLDEGPA